MFPTKVLLLGHKGFVGQKLMQVFVESRIANKDTHSLYYLTSSVENLAERMGSNAVPVAFNDLKNYEFDVIINCLAKRSVPQLSTSDSEVLESCYLLPKRVIELGAGRETTIINLSTYIQNVDGVKGRAFESYSKAKNLLTEFLEEGARNGKWHVIDLFLFTLYGKEDKPTRLIPQLLNAARNGTTLPMTMGEQLISLLNVSELCETILEIVKDSGKKGLMGAYTCWRDQYISIRDLVNVVEVSLGVPVNCDWGAIPYRGHEMFTPWNLNFDRLYLLNLKNPYPLKKGILEVALDYGLVIS